MPHMSGRSRELGDAELPGSAYLCFNHQTARSGPLRAQRNNAGFLLLFVTRNEDHPNKRNGKASQEPQINDP